MDFSPFWRIFRATLIKLIKLFWKKIEKFIKNKLLAKIKYLNYAGLRYWSGVCRVDSLDILEMKTIKKFYRIYKVCKVLANLCNWLIISNLWYVKFKILSIFDRQFYSWWELLWACQTLETIFKSPSRKGLKWLLRGPRNRSKSKSYRLVKLTFPRK